MQSIARSIVILSLFVVLCVANPLPPSCLKVDELPAGKQNPADGEWLVATDNPKFS